MQIHALEIDDFSNDDYILIGIHSALEEFQLAYLLNQCLLTNFKRAKHGLDFENKNNNATFSIYEYENTKFSQFWFLIENKYVDTLDSQSSGFFQSNEITTYLIPEQKKVDFFLKLEGDFDPEFIQKTIEKINNINQVITSYTIDVYTLKSKDFLIF
ncbi:hypothetical protein GCM10011416_06150 [Polaribacter pacificus]|uniref:IPExxxVDY family protein n=1 Tax=Polaribacter pacificus TaxID=1775173 RepID=A0A917HWE4_9FLAO|nr:IPExxxVDY family protein [Polaribacter pacificus]GGG92076.1 hypothetical protein GCM10011416_06150 [Polaribacter pacificus]